MSYLCLSDQITGIYWSHKTTLYYNSCHLCHLCLEWPTTSYFVDYSLYGNLKSFYYTRSTRAHGGIAPNQVIARSELEVHREIYKE